MYSSVWNWERVADVIRGLRGRHGFPPDDRLNFLGFVLDLNSGELYDSYLSRKRDDLAPSVYFVLYRYAHAEDEAVETGELIIFRQLYGGDLYYNNYKNNVLNALNREFSSNIDLLLEVSRILGASDAKVAGYDMSVKIHALPLVPIYVAIDLGGGEFQPLINLYFDASIKTYFTAEEASHLSEILVTRLVELSKELKA
jgi:hypothetical protein